MFGFMGKILRVDLTSGNIAEEALPEDVARKYLGGAGIATRYLYDEVPKGTDPLGPDNKLIFFTGPLTGTTSPSSSRYSVVTKSPLTGIWGQSNSGGSFGPALKRSGFDGIIFEGESAKPVYLKIQDGQAELCEAGQLWGKNVHETEDQLGADLGKEFTFASIGPAGENLVKYAAIMNNKHRAAGRCGVGAVMGAKKLKAIAVSGKARSELANKEGIKTGSLRMKTLWPFCENRIKELAEHTNGFVVVEINYGQMVLEVERAAGGKSKVLLQEHMGAGVPTNMQILEKIREAAK